jgi:uncharacterized membrane protein
MSAGDHMLAPLLIAFHVLGVVIWIGGVAFVTMIVFPMIVRMEGSLEKMLLFQGMEHRFAKTAKFSVFIVGLTGGWLLSATGEWRNLFTIQGIGPTLMLIVWTFYVLVLIFEGKLFKIIFRGKAQQDTTKVFYRLTVFHWIVLVLSLLTVGTGVWTGHGGVSFIR